jgi:ribosomal protein S18 acetylase RimI-like enzyme
MPAFDLITHELAGAGLRPLAPGNAARLGQELAAIPPWSIIGLPAKRLTRGLSAELPSMRRFELLCGGELGGVVSIQHPFLHGPYLQLLAILPPFQGRNLGLQILQWMEVEALTAEARQLWLCVSTFNARARQFYERFGFESVAVLDRLSSDASDELFMRKRLTIGTPTP